jgi:nucleoside-diphosphate-sugar epimerase
MYMPDAIRATVELMEADAKNITIRTSYNISGMSFSPKEIGREIQKHIPEFAIAYQPDYRQTIAESWPQSIDDTIAKNDWNWKPAYNLEIMSSDMLTNMRLSQKR